MNERTLEKSKEFKELSPNYTFAYELKFVDLSKNKRISFNCIKKTSARRTNDKTQYAFLKKANSGKLHINISDAGRIKAKIKEFDGFFCVKEPAFVIVAFYEKYKHKMGYYISINDWVKMEANTIMKSLDENLAREYATHIFDYQNKKKLL